ncbi:MAG TPA: hypothetical protein VMJ33_01985 [Gallionella sp.]|nr:hypothetical protein [Gallionella sp.]
MSNLIPGSYNIQDTMQICVWIFFIILAVMAQTAHSEEGAIANGKFALTPKLINPGINQQSPYRFNTNLAFNHPNEAVNSEPAFNRSPRSLNFTEPNKEDDWSINIQKQAPSSSDCSATSTLPCFDSKDDQLKDAKPQQESYWLVLRKVFHFW